MLQDPATNNGRLLRKRRNRNLPRINPAAFTACIKRLSDNGGAYNRTRDKDFKPDTDDSFPTTLNDTASGWEVSISETGSTSAILLTESGVEDTSVADLGLNLITNISTGVGVIALSELQMNRNGSAVGLYLGYNSSPGHVVMGGYNTALIDSTQGTVVYDKQGDMAGQFEVHLTEIAYLPSGGSEATADGISIPIDKTPLRLSYNSPINLLPEAILEKLLPHLGSPQYDEEVNGYLYPASPVTDYSLMFTLAGNNSIARITVPASSLLMQEPTDDNPLTGDVFESGREYLLFSPLRASSPDNGIGYFGRSFLKHIYMVDDYYLQKFFISAVNITSAASKTTNLTSDSAELMLSTPVTVSPVSETTTSAPDSSKDNKPSKSKLVGSILGGLIGGIVILWLIVLFFYFRKRRAQNQLVSQNGDFEGNKEIENEKFSASYSGKGRHETRRVGPQTRPTGETVAKTARGFDASPTPTSRSTKKAVLASSPELTRIEETPADPIGSFTDKTHRPPLQSPFKPDPHTSGPVVQKRFSEPTIGNSESSYTPRKKRYQSAPVLARGQVAGGPYKHFLLENNGTEDIQATQHILSYHQLLAHHRAHRRYASYLDSESSNGNDNDTSTITTTTSAETATVGKVIAKGQVAHVRQLSPTSPHVALANSLESRASFGRVVLPSSLERRASIGRVVLPGEIVVLPPSRRTSRSSRELHNTPRKYPSSPTSGAEGIGNIIGGAPLGHRRQRSAPSDLGLLSRPGLPPQRAQDDIFVGGVRTIGGQTVRPTSSIHSAPVLGYPQPTVKSSVGTFLFEDSPSASSSSTVLPLDAKPVVSGSSDEPESQDDTAREE